MPFASTVIFSSGSMSAALPVLETPLLSAHQGAELWLLPRSLSAHQGFSLLLLLELLVLELLPRSFPAHQASPSGSSLLS